MNLEGLISQDGKGKIRELRKKAIIYELFCSEPSGGDEIMQITMNKEEFKKIIKEAIKGMHKTFHQLEGGVTS